MSNRRLSVSDYYTSKRMHTVCVCECVCMSMCVCVCVCVCIHACIPVCFHARVCVKGVCMWLLEYYVNLQYSSALGGFPPHLKPNNIPCIICCCMHRLAIMYIYIYACPAQAFSSWHTVLYGTAPVCLAHILYNLLSSLRD